ncbi:glycosyltransferase [Acetobacter malorum]|nr:glycosyltransferase [Acetobacter malorum]
MKEGFPLSLIWKSDDIGLSNLPAWSFETPPLSIHLIPSLNLGGAEKIVLDLTAHRSLAGGRIHVFVLDTRNSDTHEFVPGTGAQVTVFTQKSWNERLKEVARLAIAQNVPIYCHLTSASNMLFLQSLGAKTIPVIHNEAKGWRTDYRPVLCSPLTPFIAACSARVAEAVQAVGTTRPVRIMRHLPLIHGMLNREEARTALKISPHVPAIGMIGRLDAQKNYIRAVSILADLRKETPDCILVIIGPWSFGDGPKCKDAITRTAKRLGLEVGIDILLLGGLPNASRYLPAFDAFLNTSLWEGLSMACMEAVVAKVPCIASLVGGQKELGKDVTLIDIAEPNRTWVSAIKKVLPTSEETGTQKSRNLLGYIGDGLAVQWPWASHFSAIDECSLRKDKVLFVTLDLNVGGAQKSLCNLMRELPRTGISPILAVNGKIGVPSYLSGLDDIPVVHLAGSDDSGLRGRISRICSLLDRYKCGSLCFWNVDALTKSMIANILAPSPIRVIDVSPGPMLYSELSEEFTGGDNGTSLSASYYLNSLDAIVNKYHVESPVQIKGQTWSIPNGVYVPDCLRPPAKIQTNPFKIAVCGRLSPSKYPELLPDIARELQTLAGEGQKAPEIHVYGGFHKHHPHLARRFISDVLDGQSVPENLFFHGPTDFPQLAISDAGCLLMLSKDQGCPNASLEALSLGIPVVANATGGVGEQVITDVTGTLFPEAPPPPKDIAAALYRICTDSEFRSRLSENAILLTRQKFSMESMATNYANLFLSLQGLY